MLNSCFIDKDFHDQIILGKICFDILSIPLENKSYSDEFCAIWLEGRNRIVDSYEEYSAFKSIKLFSQYNYPIYVFLNKNCKKFLDEKTIKDYRIKIIPIDEVNNRKDYCQFFYKYNVYDKLDGIENTLSFHPDGFLIKEGWEEFCISNNFDYIGSHWCHFASISSKDIYINNALSIYNPVCIGNGGFSYRKASKMREIIKNFANLNIFETGRQDYFPPPEDLFFSYFGFNTNCKIPTLKQCCDFSRDPIDLNAYLNKKSFGFHRPVFQNKYLCTQHN